MRKNLLPLLLLAPLLTVSPAGAAPPPSVLVDGNLLRFDQPPVEQGGRLLVPLRGIFESLGATVQYNAATRAIQATRGQTTVQLALGSRDASVNGQVTTLDVPANTIGGRALVPLRFVSEALGAHVSWDASSHTVTITSTGSSTYRPRLDNVILEAQGNLSPGDVARVLAQGEAGGQAWFEVAGHIPRIDMVERSRGNYEGSWTVPKGVHFQASPVIVHLLVKGQQADAEAPLRLSVGAAAPTQLLRNVHLSSSGPLRTGQVLVVTAQGQPGMSATLDISRSSAIPMAEVSPGTYRANYVVQGVQYGPTDAAMPNSEDFGTFYATVHLRANDGRVDSKRSTQQVTLDGRAAPLRVTSPRPGALVPPNFNLQGEAAPLSLVEITVQAWGRLIAGGPEVLLASRVYQAQVNNNGHFKVMIQSGGRARPGSRLLISAVSRNGRSQYQLPTFQVRRY